jgi:hypothetical protein
MPLRRIAREFDDAGAPRLPALDGNLAPAGQELDDHAYPMGTAGIGGKEHGASCSLRL